MRVELHDSLENIFPDSIDEKKARGSLEVAVGRCGTASVHVLVTGLIPGQEVRLGIQGHGLPSNSARWFSLVDVPVEENTGMSGFTVSTRWDDGSVAGANPHVIRKAPFRIFDPMAPTASRLNATSATMVFRVQIPVPADIRPGHFKVSLTVSTGKETGVCIWGVEIFKVCIPPSGVHSLNYTNWCRYDLMATRHGLKPWSPGHWAMLRRYIRLMAHGRQNTAWVPLRDFFTPVEGGRLVFHKDRLERLLQLLAAEGIAFFEGGQMATADPAAPQWKAERLTLAMAPKTYATGPEGYRHLLQICPRLQDVIRQLGLQGRWIQHLSDEPNALLAQDYRLLAGWVRKLMPGVEIVEALMDASFAGAVDIWCPTLKNYQEHRVEYESHRQEGDRLWVYTCCVPGGPWINRLLDQELLRPVLLGWGLVRFDLHGFLHWGLNMYHERHPGLPFEQSTIKEGNLTYPAGDTHVIYPGPDEPWSSLRFEAQREGFEDAELLRALKTKSPHAATALIRTVFRDFKTYTRKIPRLRAARRRLLVALSE